MAEDQRVVVYVAGVANRPKERPDILRQQGAPDETGKVPASTADQGQGGHDSSFAQTYRKNVTPSIVSAIPLSQFCPPLPSG